MYDTLEEFVVCGASHFHVQELSDRLKQKSVKDKVGRSRKKRVNEYEREYAVSRRRLGGHMAVICLAVDKTGCFSFFLSLILKVLHFLQGDSSSSLLFFFLLGFVCMTGMHFFIAVMPIVDAFTVFVFLYQTKSLIFSLIPFSMLKTDGNYFRYFRHDFVVVLEEKTKVCQSGI